jgi:tetratricopeptide (TPR) repeat protein
MLFDQSRHKLAEKELRLAIAGEPDPAFAHALLALCLVEQEQLDEATREAQAAIHAEPDLAFVHYAHGHVMLRRRRIDEASAAAGEALRLDPETAAYHALVAHVRMEQRQWPAALEAAEAGLSVDAEDVDCTNLRAQALVNLGRKAEAGATIDGALRRNPENAATHANQGWTLLHQAEPKKAMEHFREALRLDPGNEWARAGIVEALKARNLVYGVMLRYFLWMGRLSSGTQWAILLGGCFGQRALQAMAKTHPDLAPWIMPIIFAYVAFAMMTWIAVPLFNLFLRLHPIGKHALSEEQKTASNWIGACLLLALVSLSAWLATSLVHAQFSTITFGLLLLPLCGTFNCNVGWPRRVMAGLTAVLFLVNVAVLVPGAPVGGLTAIFFLGVFLSQFIALGLSRVVPGR